MCKCTAVCVHVYCWLCSCALLPACTCTAACVHVHCCLCARALLPVCTCTAACVHVHCCLCARALLSVCTCTAVCVHVHCCLCASALLSVLTSLPCRTDLYSRREADVSQHGVLTGECLVAISCCNVLPHQLTLTKCRPVFPLTFVTIFK